MLLSTTGGLTVEQICNGDVHINLTFEVTCTGTSGNLYYFTTVLYLEVECRLVAMHFCGMFRCRKKIGLGVTAAFPVSTFDTDHKPIDGGAGGETSTGQMKDL